VRLARRRALAPVVAVIAIAAGACALHALNIRAADLALPEACIASSDEPQAPGAGMVFIAADRFMMGSEDYRREEAPVRQSTAGGFWIDSHDVTNVQFARFVRETGYLTVAERARTLESDQRPGSFVFVPPVDVADLDDPGQWWRFVPGADWRHPEGPQSTIAHRMNHPVVQVAYEDAEAYARWAGRSLPSETQWEFAARGGLDGVRFNWGNQDDSDEAPQSNHWRGIFPTLNLGSKGFKGTSPVGCFPPNGYGLYDMAGNVWQWTQDAWHGRATSGSIATPVLLPSQFRVIKGGSFLCAANFCMRYRPAARQPGDASIGASHIGFRTVLALPARALPPSRQRASLLPRQGDIVPPQRDFAR
jgi:formylglycine-generating enzyme